MTSIESLSREIEATPEGEVIVLIGHNESNVGQEMVLVLSSGERMTASRIRELCRRRSAR